MGKQAGALSALHQDDSYVGIRAHCGTVAVLIEMVIAR